MSASYNQESGELQALTSPPDRHEALTPLFCGPSTSTLRLTSQSPTTSLVILLTSIRRATIGGWSTATSDLWACDAFPLFKVDLDVSSQFVVVVAVIVHLTVRGGTTAFSDAGTFLTYAFGEI